MSKKSIRDLSGVAETMLITLYFRAVESRRPDALLRDEKAAALVERMSGDFDKVRRMPISEIDRTTIILRLREFDRRARDFMARHPGAPVVHFGCGLDTRFERVDDGRVEWYDLDFPEVIDLRRRLLGDGGKRHRFIGRSLFDAAWLDELGPRSGRRCLFLAEGVSMYCSEAEVRWLVLLLRDRFPGAEFVFDAFSPFHVWMSNRRIPSYKLETRFRFGTWSGRKIERWGDGIRLNGDWGFFDDPEPRTARYRWMRRVWFFNRVMRVYSFRLGEPESGA